MRMSNYDGVQMPGAISVDREPIAVGVMAQPGDPVLDMALSLRNIEWLLLMQEQRERAQEQSEAKNGEPAATVARGKRTDAQSKTED